jgi:4-alpha-glucanotransferase
MLPLEDLRGQEEQPNLPGTVTEHPNWRRRMPAAADALLQCEATAARIAVVGAERPRR